MTWRRSLIPLLLGSWVSAGAVCAVDERPYEVPAVTAPPVVDGELADPAWREAARVDDFVARLPVDGAVPSVRTEVWLVHTERALYVALRAFDPEPGTIRAASMRRDDFAITGGDQFVIAIDSFRDRRNGYWFSTNPLAARVDAQFSDEGDRFEDAWDGVWEAAARIDASGWSAELEIPWATLRFPDAPEVVMGINLFRRIPRTNEQIFAPRVPLEYAAGTPNVSIARPYRFRGIRGGTRLDVRPFALAAAERRTAEATRSEADGGLFVRVPLTDALTVAGTLRADFSEVEADESQLNLTRFPLFLPEKRDFFLEEAGLFAFGVPGEAELYFSRTLGLAIDADGEATTVPIDWGVQGTGRVGPLEMGVLAGATGDAAVAPGERFDVARPRWRLGGRSTLGGFWSRRESGEAGRHATYGVDFSHYFAREVRAQGFAARDRRETGRDDAWFVSLARGGERSAFELSVLDLEPGFAPAVGLVARPGTRRYVASATVPWFPAADHAVRRFAPGLAWVRYEQRPTADLDERVTLSFATAWRDDRTLTAELLRQRERLSAPFAIYRDVVVPAGDYERWEAGLVAVGDPTRPVAGEAEARAGELYGGHHAFGRLSLTWRPSRFLELSPALLADRVELPSARFTAWVGRLRLGLTASPRLRFDLLAQFESEERGAGLGLRARYDFREGTELLLAWDAVETRPPLADRAAQVRSDRGALKISYLVRF